VAAPVPFPRHKSSSAMSAGRSASAYMSGLPEEVFAA
jgi:hypothetical protein